jgi:hypothetical protein
MVMQCLSEKFTDGKKAAAERRGPRRRSVPARMVICAGE